MPPPATRFGNFLLIERLAIGGMGELFLAARHGEGSPPPDRDSVVRPEDLVALKILLPQFRENADFVGMFEDEARIGMRLAHRNVVGVLEIGKTEGTPFIVMEYVHGENLRAVLRALYMQRETLSPALALHIAIEVLEGLDHAHRARDESGRRLQLVHRDLSPDNVLISYEGEVKILDFGIAKAEGRATETQLGVLKGKAQYMPPEQANGRSVDSRADLFSVGVVLLESITGEKRFSFEDPLQQYAAARTWQPVGPSAKFPELPAGLDAILLKSMQPEPSHRFRTADEFASAITRLLRSGVIQRSPESVRELMGRLFPNRRASAATKLIPSNAEPTATDLSQPPRWTRDEEEEEPISIARNLAAMPVELENTRPGEGADVMPVLGAIAEPDPSRAERAGLRGTAEPPARRPTGTRLSSDPVDESIDILAPPPETSGSGSAVNLEPIARDPHWVDRKKKPAAEDAPTGDTTRERDVPLELAPRRAPVTRSDRDSGPLFAERRPKRQRGGILAVIALTVVLGIIIMVGSLIWGAREAKKLLAHASPIPSVETAVASPVDSAPVASPSPVESASAVAVATLTPIATPAETPSLTSASVKVSGKIGGLITVDRVATKKKTPATLSLKPGKHTVTVAWKGRRPFLWSGTVKAGDALEIKAQPR